MIGLRLVMNRDCNWLGCSSVTEGKFFLSAYLGGCGGRVADCE